MKKITADNRREICDKERECLTKKQELLRGGCQRVGSARNCKVLLHPKKKRHSFRAKCGDSLPEVGAEAQKPVVTNTI